jgi:hypothetical protein
MFSILALRSVYLIYMRGLLDSLMISVYRTKRSLFPHLPRAHRLQVQVQRTQIHPTTLAQLLAGLSVGLPLSSSSGCWFYSFADGAERRKAIG